MKILIGILVIVLAVFLNSVELGTPLGTGFPFRPGAAPKPVSVPSGKRQTGKGGRYGMQKSRSTPQPAAPEAPPATSETDRERSLKLREDAIPRGTYIEHPKFGFTKITEKLGVVLMNCRRIVIGRVEGDDILPIFNKRHEIIRIDYNQNGLRIPMNETEARRWGVFEKYAQVIRTPPPAFL